MTPHQDTSAEHDAFSDEDIAAIIAGLDDDAAMLSDENPDDEIASNLRAAANLIETLQAALVITRAAFEISKGMR